ncbi:hypothetical protein BG005_008328 [Podila minutissima]|nr:hypothetical protein BG005_008328 [Podila minutissima]
MTSLLLLPKLIYRIGVFIPCWTREEEEWDRDFCPKDLVTACKSLDISAVVLLQNSHLSTTNPDLAELMLGPGENADCEDIRSTLESISQLTVIQLNNVVLTGGGQLGSFFNNNTGLKVLALAIYQALLRHAKTLESVSLMLRECSVNNAINTGKLLANCPNLRHVH